ncbi:MAG: group 1 truncated hemoglobin [Candidatus Latescibacteria bacterium]|nr:group 1 truncated hemoglobin [Candidatus Latescibacterota bacterium]
MQNRCSSLALLAVLALAAPWGQAIAQEKPDKTLYERLGGAYAIASVVDDFIELLLRNDVLNANPAIAEARARVPKAGLKFHVTSLVCAVTGGSEQYTGRTMKEAHVHLRITEREWQAMLADFRRVLNDYKVPEREQGELIAIVESTKPEIVISEAQGKP